MAAENDRPGDPAPSPRPGPGRTAPRLALAVATFNRPQALLRLVRSARAHAPDLPIYVCDQSHPDPVFDAALAELGARLVRVPYDSGVCVARNALVGAIEEPYFVLCDDDFILRPDTRFDAAAAILDARPDIGVIGGRLWDIFHGKRHHRSWELFLNLDHANRQLVALPIQTMPPITGHVGGIRYFHCDAVMNFAVMRRAMFDRGVGWDPRFKSNGEHEDFYLALKESGAAKVVYLPAMVADHEHLPGRGYGRLRDRSAGWRMFLEKWDIERYLDIGNGVREIADAGRLIREPEARKRFLSAHGGTCVSATDTADAALLVEPGGRAVPAAPYAWPGEARHEGHAATAALVVGAGRVLPAPAVREPATVRGEHGNPDPEHIPMFPLPPDSAVALAYPAHESSGDTLLAWIHVPRTDLPKRHAVVLRWRRGARYLGWARGRVVVEAGPDRATWQVAAVPIPPTTGAVTLELWGDGPGARLLAAGAVELRPADAPVAAPEMLLAPALLPEGATVGGLRRAALRHPDPLPRFERIAAEPGATVALDGRRAHVPAGLPHGIGWIRTDATAGDDSGPIPLRLVAAE